jgi:hypothetical protein
MVEMSRVGDCVYTLLHRWASQKLAKGEGRYRWCSFHISITRRMLTSAGLV